MRSDSPPAFADRLKSEPIHCACCRRWSQARVAGMVRGMGSDMFEPPALLRAWLWSLAEVHRVRASQEPPSPRWGCARTSLCVYTACAVFTGAHCSQVHAVHGCKVFTGEGGLHFMLLPQGCCFSLSGMPQKLQKLAVTARQLCRRFFIEPLSGSSAERPGGTSFGSPSHAHMPLHMGTHARPHVHSPSLPPSTPKRASSALPVRKPGGNSRTSWSNSKSDMPHASSLHLPFEVESEHACAACRTAIMAVDIPHPHRSANA